MLSKSNAALVAIASAALVGAANNGPGVTFTVPLTGAEEANFVHPSGGTGDPDASGSVTLRIDPASKQICYDFALSGASTPLMAHIHEGQPLANGPPVVTLFTGPGADLDGCVTWLHNQLAEIVADPSNFYVDIDTTEFPDGALRGQLSKG